VEKFGQDRTKQQVTAAFKQSGRDVGAMGSGLSVSSGLGTTSKPGITVDYKFNGGMGGRNTECPTCLNASTLADTEAKVEQHECNSSYNSNKRPCGDRVRSFKNCWPAYDLHQQTNETIEAGRSSGRCTVGGTITWRAKHLGFHQRLTVEIVRCDFPSYFEDRMKKGAFKPFTHRHYFELRQTETLMKDIFEFESPMGIIGKLFNWIFLKGYMTKLLLKRAEVIKAYAESGQGKSLPRIKM
jgi:ligand-binding SRPBCC domain-containing protein